ncbi:MAG: hypothetical protein OZSIB_2716 [Candidatus Ozemobacter sibiricus]|uniref:Tetratricopeptide repeat protein n=1 Tax=Candidatus Ozemobacter sibiricus TaxID=2268124 RepID=A0A367ZRT7_9BACT|nr:MAG: hypothetical protein OZSIB_2716 [Candidatus Ozemobacter sibiricus]
MNITMKRMPWVLGLVLSVILLVPGGVRAADENDILQLEKQLIQKESELLEPELRLDTLLVERAKLDGVGGWFQGSKKKELERQIGEQTALIDRLAREMAALQKQVQDMVFAVGQTYEKNGDYRKAIEYYLKVKNQDDKVRFRIASCYKALKEYELAIQWILKMARTDANALEIVDCYKLDGRMKEAVYWLFQILEPIDGNPAELTALDLIERYNYPNRPLDYPNFNQRLSDVYLAKAVFYYKKDFAVARADYQKAINLIAGNAEPKSVSLGILARYQNEYKVALDILDQQREAAERYYENKLREAKTAYDEAEYRYRRAQRDAEDEYARRLEWARRDMEKAERDLRALEAQASPSAELLAQARQRVQYTRDQYYYLVNNRNRFIEEYVRPARREMEEAMERYNEIVSNRTRIIENYIAPYKAKVAAAKEAFELMRSLHEAVYGMR